MQSTYPERKHPKDGPNRLPDLVHGTIVHTVRGFQILNEAVDLLDPLAKHRLLTLEVRDETLHLVEGALSLGTALGLLDDGVDFGGGHEIEGRGAAYSERWAGEGERFGGRSAKCGSSEEVTEHHGVE